MRELELVPGVAGTALPDMIDQAVEVRLGSDISNRELGRGPAEALFVRLLELFPSLEQNCKYPYSRIMGLKRPRNFHHLPFQDGEASCRLDGAIESLSCSEVWP